MVVGTMRRRLPHFPSSVMTTTTTMPPARRRPLGKIGVLIPPCRGSSYAIGYAVVDVYHSSQRRRR